MQRVKLNSPVPLFSLYDNSINDYNPKLLYRTADGEVIKIYSNLNPWAADIVDLLCPQKDTDD